MYHPLIRPPCVPPCVLIAVGFISAHVSAGRSIIYTVPHHDYPRGQATSLTKLVCVQLEAQKAATELRAEEAEADVSSKQARIEELELEIERLKAIKPPPLPTKKSNPGRWSNPGNGSGLFSNVAYLNESSEEGQSKLRRANQVSGNVAA